MSIQDEQIDELNATVKCKLAPSKIHGVGVFAIMDIPKGQRVHCRPDQAGRIWYNVPYGSLSKLLPEIKELVLERWPSIVNGSNFTSPNDCWPICWMNHADTPNYEMHTDTALIDIKKGEEITEDYRKMINYGKVYPWLVRE